MPMLETVLAKVRTMIEGDPGIRKVADDPVLSAELLLLFRMILADGKVDDSEMKAFRRICRDSFGIEEDSIDGVVDYLNDYGYETTGTQAVALFRDLDLERRKRLALHMAEIAKADTELAAQEIRLLKRTLELLGVSARELASPNSA
jgi:uncharacterized tellurite resistance protein B-like protein